MSQAILSGSIKIVDLYFSVLVIRDEEGGIQEKVTLPMAYEGTVKSKDDEFHTAVLTVPGHNFEAGNYLTVFLGATKQQCNYGEITSVDNDDVYVTDTDNTNFPAVGTEIIAGRAVFIDIADFRGAVVTFAAAQTQFESYVRFTKASGPPYGRNLEAGAAWFWFSEAVPEWPSPFGISDEVVGVFASSASTVADQELMIGIQYSSVP